jgi:hypothetical protein
MRSDLNLLKEFGEALAPADEHPPARLRDRVLHGTRRGRRRPSRVAAWPAGARVAWRIGAPATVAAAIAAGLIAANTATNAGNAPAPPRADGGTATGASRTQPAIIGVGQVLTLAARHAETTPLMTARADQFLYVESTEVRSELRGKNLDTVRLVGPVRVQTWLSVDGTRDGLVVDAADGRTRLSGCRDGLRSETIDRPDTTPKVPCTPEPAYRDTAVPTDPEALLAYLYDPATVKDMYVWVGKRGPRAEGPFIKLSRDQRAFMKLAELLYQNHSPTVQAAAFRTAARIPGVELRSGVADAAGRVGVAVTRTEVGAREELVFHRQTYAYLGHNSIVAEFDVAGATVQGLGPGEVDGIRLDINRNRRPGDVIQKLAVLRIGITDRAGQRP